MPNLLASSWCLRKNLWFSVRGSRVVTKIIVLQTAHPRHSRAAHDADYRLAQLCRSCITLLRDFSKRNTNWKSELKSCLLWLNNVCSDVVNTWRDRDEERCLSNAALTRPRVTSKQTSNTVLWLVKIDHVSWTLTSDWSNIKIPDEQMMKCKCSFFAPRSGLVFIDY